MKNILSFTVLTLALTFTAACSNDQNKDKPNMDIAELPPLQQPVPVQTDMVETDIIPGVNAGAQEQLVATAGDRVFFGYDSSSLSAEAKDTLNRQAAWLASNGSSVTVEGHCDERGTREYNLALGEKRAQAAKSYLVSQGIAPNRITTISYGKEFPEFMGSNAESWAKNRRSVTVVNN